MPATTDSISALADALDARKRLTNTNTAPEELRKLAARHNVDAEVLERLARVVNTPSEVEGSRRKVVDEEGQERWTVLVSSVSALLYLDVFADVGELIYLGGVG